MPQAGARSLPIAQPILYPNGLPLGAQRHAALGVDDPVGEPVAKLMRREAARASPVHALGHDDIHGAGRTR